MRNVPPEIRIMSAVLTLAAADTLSTRERGSLSIHACSLMRQCYAREQHKRVGPWSNDFPWRGAKTREATGGRGGGGIAASRIMRLTSQTDVLGWEFLPIKCSCRLDRGPIPAAAQLPSIFANEHFHKVAAASF